MSDEPTLFDALPDDEAPAEWQEVPQARFDSWSPAMQLSYCAARDYASSDLAETEDEARFYIERAEGYRADLELLK